MFQRLLSNEFLNDLCEKEGLLHPILKRVHNDSTLDLQIRNEAINIYYRGGSLAQITRIKQGGYKNHFSSGYLKHSDDSLKSNDIPPKLSSSSHVSKLLSLFPQMKQSIDFKLKSGGSSERQFQQFLVQENNYSAISSDTDYIICDLEYSSTLLRKVGEKKGSIRLDLLAAHWPSTSQDRQNLSGLKLSILELKYADGALGGKSGLEDHLTDLKIVADHLPHIANEMTSLIRQKVKLGLIHKSELHGKKKDKSDEISITADHRVDWILVFANHKPASSVLFRELEKLEEKISKDKLPFNIKIAISNFMGTGLYSENCLSVAEFIKRFPPKGKAK